ncbi:MAG: hypothetical protein ACRDYU_10945 [Actinomycetes bacterium]
MDVHGEDAGRTDDTPREPLDPVPRSHEERRELRLRMAVAAEKFAVTEDLLAGMLLEMADQGGPFAERRRGLAADASQGALAARQRAAQLRQDADTQD